MRKIEWIILVSAAIIGLYYMTALSQAYFAAINCYIDARNSQIAQIMGGK